MARSGADANLKLGQTVESQDGREGIIRYAGPLHIAAGQWLGLELSENTGKNDGSVKGERYFTCKPGHGIFVRKESAVRVVRQAVTAHATPKLAPTTTASTAVGGKVNGTAGTGTTGDTTSITNGSIPKSGPISGSRSTAGVISADVARKRQSLMSAGSGSGAGSVAGSRVSLRSTTKSPTKAAASSASSAGSTPRTGTPAATTRLSGLGAKSRPSLAGKTLATSTAKNPPARLTGESSRPSIGTPMTRAAARPSVAASESSLRRGAPTQVRTTNQSGLEERKLKERENLLKSPTIKEDQEENDQDDEDDGDDGHESDEDDEGSEQDPTTTTLKPTEEIETRKPSQPVPEAMPPPPRSPVLPRSRTVSITRSNITSAAEAKATQQRELEEMKARLKIMEQKRQEDRDKLRSMETLQADRDRFENIIQALQRKIKSHQRDMTELKARCEAAEALVKEGDRSAELESEVELATLDKEMAEERAETLELELEALKTRHEELELETEILREENRELASVMSPEEKANAGWLQMERETERLRQALMMLRDMSQQNESDMRSEIKDLRRSLDDAETVTAQYDEITQKLKRSEDTNKHLMQQLEAAETNDEVVEAMEMQREQTLATIDKLKKQIQDLEEHIQVTDELEIFHVDEEKRLHSALDESEALLSEQVRLTLDQERSIEDLEYTITKFRDVVQGLQNDIDELRRSRDISEVEAHEMSSKSRAMMELNLQLQSSAAKTQLKTIDLEMGKIKAEEASLHLEIMRHFVMGSYTDEQKPILALLAFKRMKSKALLIRNLLADRIRDRITLIDDPLALLRTIELMSELAGQADRFILFLMTCRFEDFSEFTSVSFDLEPVEKTLNGWIEALRRDELARDETGHLSRMLGIIYDIGGKLVRDTPEYTSASLLSQTGMIECYMDSASNLLQIMLKTVQAKLGMAEDEDDESFTFDKKVNQLAAKTRTIKYATGRMRQNLLNMQSRSVLPSDEQSFYSEVENMETTASHINRIVQVICKTVLDDLADEVQDNVPTYASITDAATDELQNKQTSINAEFDKTDDAFLILAKKLQSFHKELDHYATFSINTDTIVEFYGLPKPWIARAKALKAQKIISQDVEEELNGLKKQNRENTIRLTEREKQLEEQQIRIELLEARKRETKIRDESLKAMKRELDGLQDERDGLATELNQSSDALEVLQKEHQTQKSELESLRKGQKTQEDIVVAGPADAFQQAYLHAEIEMVKSELLSLQACVRFLRTENHSLRIPPHDSTIAAIQTSWLESPVIRQPRHTPGGRQIRTESKDVFAGLIALAQEAKPVSLKSRKGPTSTTMATQRTARISTKHQILKQHEEFERWSGWKDDLVQRVKLASSGQRPFAERVQVIGMKGSDTLSNKKSWLQHLTPMMISQDDILHSTSDGVGVGVLVST